jgi:hypothetical protein
VVKSKEIRYVFHVARVKEMRKSCNLSVGKDHSEELWATHKLILEMDRDKITAKHKLAGWFMGLRIGPNGEGDDELIKLNHCYWIWYKPMQFLYNNVLVCNVNIKTLKTLQHKNESLLFA